MNMSFTKMEFVCDSSAIRLRVGCGHKHPCVFSWTPKKAIFEPFSLRAGWACGSQIAAG